MYMIHIIYFLVARGNKNLSITSAKKCNFNFIWWGTMLYVCLCVCVYVCVCMHMRVCVCVCAHSFISVRFCLCVPKYIRLCVYVNVSVSLFVGVSVYLKSCCWQNISINIIVVIKPWKKSAFHSLTFLNSNNCLTVQVYFLQFSKFGIYETKYIKLGLWK